MGEASVETYSDLQPRLESPMFKAAPVRLSGEATFCILWCVSCLLFFFLHVNSLLS